MRTDAQTRLYNYRCELQMISEQISNMQSQLAEMTSQVTSLQGYCRDNSNDKMAMARYKKSVSDYRGLQAQLRNMQKRAYTLQQNIAKEEMKIMYKHQRRTRQGFM